MDSPNHARPLDYLGLLLASLATLMLEILLTRIFSVTLWYHLAFIAISFAMFGMTLGAMLVYLKRHRYTPQRAWHNLAWSAAAFGAAAVFSVLLILRIPLLGDPWAAFSLPALVTVSVIYIIASIPFVFSGIAVSMPSPNSPNKSDVSMPPTSLVQPWAASFSSPCSISSARAHVRVRRRRRSPCSPPRALPPASPPSRTAALRIIATCLAVAVAAAFLDVFGLGSFRITQAKGGVVEQPVLRKMELLLPRRRR